MNVLAAILGGWLGLNVLVAIGAYLLGRRRPAHIEPEDIP